MKRRNKILNAVLWSSMISTSLLGLNVADVSAQDGQFTDVPSNHWASSTINEWKKFNVISGVDNNSFAPDQPLTRAQMAQILTNLMGYKQKVTKDFADVSPSAWYFDAVQFATHAGTMTGTGENNFLPDENITREQLMTAMAIAFGIQPSAATADFPDIASVSTWALSYVNAMIAGGYVSGMDGKINPKDIATRAQVITIIDNMVAAYNDQPLTYTGDVHGNVILRADGSTLSDAIVYGNLIVAEGVGEGAVTLNNVIITGKLIVRGGGPNSVHINGNSLFIQAEGTNVGNVIAQFRGSVIGTTRVVAAPTNGNTLKYEVSDSAIPTPAAGSTAPGAAYKDVEESNPNITAAVGQYLAIYEVDAAGNVVHFFTKQIVADDVDMPKVYRGSGIGATRVIVAPAQGNTLKYELSDSAIPALTVGSKAVGTAYTSGNDISAAIGQYLAIYEANAAGNVVNFYTKQLVEDEVNIAEVYSGSGMGTTQFSADPAQGNILKYELSDSAIPTPAVGSTASGIAYEPYTDIPAAIGQYLAIYEVDAASNVVNFYTKQLVEDEINNSDTADITE
jgi:hypothetical protein